MHQIACHDCDLVQTIPAELPVEATVACIRCGCVLVQTKKDSINRTLAWTIAAAVLYMVAISFPFLGMRSGAILRETALLSGVKQLFVQGQIVLSSLVLLTCVVIPLLQMAVLLYIFVPLKLARRPPHGMAVFRIFRYCGPWSMMEIYMLGILVAMVKLGKMATIIPGIAVVAFGMLVFVLAFAVSAIDRHLVWELLERRNER
ncbi:MAG: paraquat-inducible protein A [Desulfopila sp.]